MKRIEIKNLQAPEIEKLNDLELSGVVGGGFFDPPTPEEYRIVEEGYRLAERIKSGDIYGEEINKEIKRLGIKRFDVDRYF